MFGLEKERNNEVMKSLKQQTNNEIISKHRNNLNIKIIIIIREPAIYSRIKWGKFIQNELYGNKAYDLNVY